MSVIRLPILLIAFLLAPGPAAVLAGEIGADRGCMQETGVKSISDDRQEGDLGPLALRVIGPAAKSGVLVTCSSEKVKAISIHLPPRREAVIELVLTNHALADAPFSVTGLTTDGVEADWLTIDPPGGQAAAATDVPVTLVVRTTAEHAPGTMHQLLVRFALGEGDNASIVEVPVNLEIQGEDPMFRDRFEVDPVLGQFSYISPKSRRSNRGEFASYIPIGAGE